MNVTVSSSKFDIPEIPWDRRNGWPGYRRQGVMVKLRQDSDPALQSPRTTSVSMQCEVTLGIRSGKVLLTTVPNQGGSAVATSLKTALRPHSTPSPCHALRVGNVAVSWRRLVTRALLPFGIILVALSSTMAFAHDHDVVISFTPDSGPAGTTVTASGSGFSSGGQVQIRWGSTTGLLLASATGSAFSVEITIPEAPSGHYSVVFIDMQTQRARSGSFGLAGSGGAVPPVQPTEALCVNVTPTGNSFSDDDDTTFERLIECLAHSGITAGGPGGLPPDQYGPALPVTRAQMASFIARELDTAGRIETGTGVRPLPGFDDSNDFIDVAPDNVHLSAINRLSQAGITAGGPDGRPANEFGPNLAVNRAQMASFIERGHRLLTGTGLTPAPDYFSDDDGDAHESSINGVAFYGIAVGDGTSTFFPRREVTREQMAAFLLRHLALLEKQGAISPLPA